MARQVNTPAQRAKTTSDYLIDVLSGPGFREGFALLGRLHDQGLVRLDDLAGEDEATRQSFEEALWQRLEQEGARTPAHTAHAIAAMTGADENAFSFGQAQWKRVWQTLRQWASQSLETTQDWDWKALDAWTERAVKAMPAAALKAPEARVALVAMLRMPLPGSLKTMTDRQPAFWSLCAGGGAALFAEARQAHAWTIFLDAGNNPCARVEQLPLWKRVLPKGPSGAPGDHGFARAVHDWLPHAVSDPRYPATEREEMRQFLIETACSRLNDSEMWARTPWATRLALLEPLPDEWLLAEVSLEGQAMPAWLAPFFIDHGHDWAQAVMERRQWRQTIGSLFDLARVLLTYRTRPDSSWPAPDIFDDSLKDAFLHPEAPALIDTMMEAWPYLSSTTRARRGTRTKATAMKVRTYFDEARRHFTARMLDDSMPDAPSESRLKHRM